MTESLPAREAGLLLLRVLLFLWILSVEPLFPSLQNALEHSYEHGVKLCCCLIQARDSEERGVNA